MTSPNQVPIPGPRGVPFLGNIYDIEPEVPINSFERLADNYGTDLDLNNGCDWFG
jgi:cytochrome P450/NADPH-cytochrome P450 reductase